MSFDNDDVETPALRLEVYRGGRLVWWTFCESEDDAADALARWDDVDEVEYVVRDLGAADGPFDIPASEPNEVLEDTEYRDATDSRGVR